MVRFVWIRRVSTSFVEDKAISIDHHEPSRLIFPLAATILVATGGVAIYGNRTLSWRLDRAFVRRNLATKDFYSRSTYY